MLLGLTWLIAMTALIQRDVLPFWLAGDAPRQVFPEGRYQVGIVNEAGKRVGTTWVMISAISELTTVSSTTVFDLRTAAGLIPWAGQVMLENTLSFGAENELISFKFILRGAGVPVHISGERLGRDFACTAKIGEYSTTIPFDAGISEYLGDSMRPFTHLSNLHEGQSWRIRTVDPFALVKGQSLEFSTALAKVTRREIIDIPGGRRECFRIETDGAVAWADDSGLVLRQEVTLPLLGKWILLDEQFDNEERRRTIGQFRERSDLADDDDVPDFDDAL